MGLPAPLRRPPTTRSRRPAAPSPTTSVSASSSAGRWRGGVAAFGAQYGGDQPEATIIASGETMASHAALANGTMALGFEYADFPGRTRAYPFAVTAPLVLAEARHRSGQDLVLGIVIGYELLVRMSLAFTRLEHGPITHYVPAVLGTIGGAGARRRSSASRRHLTNYALGLAAAFTGGTFQGHEEARAALAQRRHGRRQRAVTAVPAGRDRVQGHRARARGRAGLRRFLLRRVT